MRALFLMFLACLVGFAHAASKVSAPAWMNAVVTTETPAFAKDAKALVLLDDSVRKVGVDGRISSVSRRVVRILKLDGRDAAFATIPYNADYQKILAFDAWLLAPDGGVRAYTRKQAIDVALNLDQVYTNARSLALSVAAEVEPGSVFGYSWTVDEKSIFSQSAWSFQASLPVIVSRLSLELPEGWTAEGVTLGRVPLVPVVQGGRFTWECRDLAAVPDEPWGPAAADLTLGLAIDILPSAKAQDRVPWRRFATWQDVSRYVAELHDSRAVPDAAITTKTRELVAGAATTWDKIRTIGRFVQGVNYASIQLGSGRGGGYTPNPAAQVFQRNYGDCKDKTILMRAMLQVVGVRSYSTIAFAQERRGIFEAWPSPQQFDHCIIAIAADESVEGPAAIVHPELGSILIFDPTSTLTPAGQLTSVQQGSRVLIGAGTAADLITLPYPEPAQNSLKRQMEAKLDSAGTIAAVVTEHATGSVAAGQRSEYRESTPAQFSRIIDGWISRGARAARVSRVEPKDLMTEDGAFELRVEFAAQNYAQSMGGQLLVFKPAVVPRRAFTGLNESRRVTPVLLEPNSYEETIRITLPENFAVDELPASVEITRPFGSYSLAGEMREGVLHFQRTYVVRAAEIPTDRYEEVRSFFEGINRAEQKPVVLKRK
jgi:hypothetical protein